MSTHTFDELTKQVATVTSRRQLFKVLAGAVAAVAGTLLSSRAAEAAQEHLCCVYDCPELGTVAAKCSIWDGMSTCPPMGTGKQTCPGVGTITTKCSDCGGDILLPIPT